MTYQELKEKLEKFTTEQLNMDVTVFDTNMDEFFPVLQVRETGNTADVLDPHHPYLAF